MSAVSNRFRRGWFRDPEDHHATYRMELALRILAEAGAEPTWEHSDHEGVISLGTILERRGHVCDYRCRPVWPEWVTDDVFDAVYAGADAMQTARGGWHQRQAYLDREARRQRQRAAA